LGHQGMWLTAPSEKIKKLSFRNSEAAFQATKFWHMADEFSDVPASTAWKSKNKLGGSEDPNWGGFGSSWTAMLGVLLAKFEVGTPWAEALVKTEDTFLLEHNSVKGRDKVWSDDSDGSGTNWMGLQLMLIRDQLSGRNAWTYFIKDLINLNDGSPNAGEPYFEDAGPIWQATVYEASTAVRRVVEAQLGFSTTPGVPACLRPGCNNPTWNQQPHEYCSHTCRQGDFGIDEGLDPATCVSAGCGKPTFNGLPGEYCSHTCRHSGGTSSAATDESAGGTPNCMRAGCGKPSWNGQPNEYCSRSCMEDYS